MIVGCGGDRLPVPKDRGIRVGQIAQSFESDLEEISQMVEEA